MTAVESLITEHQVIARVATALEAYAHRLQDDRASEAADLRRFADVFKDFAECIHHEKEENILLPVLSRHGCSWDSGVLPSVRREHRQETYLIEVLRHAAERAASWSDEDRRHVVAAAHALVEFQRNHHLLESAQLFPEVARRLSERELATLQAELDRFDHEHEQRRSSSLLLAEALIERYAPEALASPSVPGAR